VRSDTGTTKVKATATGSLALGAAGVVFGDIGTSPIYAFRESIAETTVGIEEAALGTASLAIWAVTLVVSVKYLMFVMKASNEGEGGILALLALLARWLNKDGSSRFGSTRLRTLVLLALLAGAALLFGDGALTPAISVLSAVEGVGEISHALGEYSVIIAVVILILLFAVQSKGTAKIGRIFGPIMVLWFIVIGGLGIFRILGNPEVLWAILPTYAFDYLIDEKLHAFTLLAVIILTVTGAEALYADMGHFGLHPIRLSWFALVKPAIILCYLGQAALVMSFPERAEDSFYGLAPNEAFTVGLVLLATMATVIASQALITGAFSLARQAIQLRLLPRMNIKHTSAHHEGQIYIPMVNWSLGVACVIITVAFGTSSNLASAYVFAVSGTMLVTTVGFTAVAKTQWKWPNHKLIPLVSIFFAVDVAFFASTATKIIDGGYVPVAIAGVIITIMVIWLTGQHILHHTVRANEPTWADLVNRLDDPGTARTQVVGVFLNSDPGRVPQALLTEVQLTRSSPREVIVVTVSTQPVPTVDETERVTSEALGDGIWRIVVNSGYMENISLPAVLNANAASHRYPWPEQGEDVIYFLGESNFRDTPDDGGDMGKAAESVYDFLQRNAASPTSFFDLPPKRVVTIGTRIDL
jgi:KUP system potassium uptake protein